MKRTLILLACVALAGCRGKKEQEAAPVVTVDVAPVLLSQIQRTIRADGLVYPKQQAAILEHAVKKNTQLLREARTKVAGM